MNQNKNKKPGSVDELIQGTRTAYQLLMRGDYKTALALAETLPDQAKKAVYAGIAVEMSNALGVKGKGEQTRYPTKGAKGLMNQLISYAKKQTDYFEN